MNSIIVFLMITLFSIILDWSMCSWYLVHELDCKDID
jgi:hypothetical protein